MCCSTYLCIHWLILVCALTGDQTHNLGVLGTMLQPTELPRQGVIPFSEYLLVPIIHWEVHFSA